MEGDYDDLQCTSVKQAGETTCVDAANRLLHNTEYVQGVKQSSNYGELK